MGISTKKQVKQGIMMATSSLSLVWLQPQILFYLAIPTAVSIVAHMIGYNLFVTPSDNHVISFLGLNSMLHQFISGPHWLHTLSAILFTFIKNLVDVMFSAALIWYLLHFFNGHAPRFRHGFSIIPTKIKIIVTWSLITMLAMLFNQSLAVGEYPKVIVLIGITLSILWELATLFVLPLIILEKISIQRAIISSALLTRHTLTLALSAISWLLVVRTASILPFYYIEGQIGGHAYAKGIILGSVIISLAIACIFQTAWILLITMIYYKEVYR